MTNELVKPQNDFDIALQGIESIGKLASLLIKTPHYRKIGEDGIYAILFACKSHGIDPFQGLNGGFNYINGRVGMSTELMAAIIRKSGHSIVLDEKSSADVCILKGRRKDTGDEWTSSFSVEDAKAADLLKNMYNKYRSVMLYNRAMSKLARQLFPDVIKGNGYSEDELIEIAYEDSTSKTNQEHENKPVKQIDIVKPQETITSDQSVELKSIVDKLTEVKQKNFYNVIKSRGFDSIDKLTPKIFSGLRINALKQLQEMEAEEAIKNGDFTNESEEELPF